MTHLYIELNTGLTEEVNSSIISKLYELAISGDLDNTSDLKGRLHSSAARDVHVAYLNEAFDDLYINADTLYITFVDPEVERVLATKYGDGTNVTTEDMSSVTSINNVDGFSYNETITLFPELKKFTNLINLNLWSFSNTTNLTTIDLTNIQHIGGEAFQRSGITGVINLPNIVSIGDSTRTESFGLCVNITEVNIGPNFNNNTLYMSKAFSDCTNLTKVTGLSNITSIPEYMFNYCTSLTSVDIDWTKITSIGLGAFRYSAITGSLTLSSLTSIGGNYENGAFRGCTGLTSVDLSGSTITSMKGTFRECTNLASVTLPNTLTSLESNVFHGCSSLQTIDLKNVTYLKEYEFRDSGLTSIDLSNIQHIGGSDVFYGCTNLTTVTFPSTSFDWFDNYNINSDRKTSFLRSCTSLTSADLSNALSIGKGMFYGDTSLTTVTLSASNITTIPEDFCSGCTSLSSLGEKIKPTRIGYNAFRDCTNLNINTYLDLSEVTYIGNWALKNTIISGSITLPECVEIGEDSFLLCWQITELHCPKLTTINQYTTFSALISNNLSNITIIDLPLLTGRMPTCHNLANLTTVYAPKTTEIYTDGFEGCTSLTNLTLDFEHITSIGGWAFANCIGLNGQIYDFGSSVTLIGAGAFEGTSISFILRNNEVVSVQDWGNNPLSQTWTGYVYVPDNLVNDYKQAFAWNLHTSQIKGISELPLS